MTRYVLLSAALLSTLVLNVAASAQTGYFAQSKNIVVAGNTTVNFVMQRF